MDTEDEVKDAGATPTRVAASKRKISRFQIKCAHCDFRVSTPALLESHARVKHLDLEWFRCKLCNFYSATSGWMEAHLSSDRHKQQQQQQENDGDETPGLSALGTYVESVNRSITGEDVSAYVEAIEDIAEGAPSLSMDGDAVTAEAAQATKTEAADEEDSELEPPKKKRGRPKLESSTKCGYCGLIVSNATNLSVHVRRKHSKEYGYSCTLCSYNCVTKGDMDRHCFTKKHERRVQECAWKNATDGCAGATPDEAATAVEQDASAASQTTNEAEKEKEKEKDTAAVPEQSGEEPSESDPSQRKVSATACGHCDFVAQSLPSLHMHVKRKHTKDFEYVCLACGYYAVTSREMWRHVNTEKHKQESQRYLERNADKGKKAVALASNAREAEVEAVEASADDGCEPAGDRAEEKQTEPEPSVAENQEESPKASPGGAVADPAEAEPQQAPAEPQPAQEEGDEQAVDEGGKVEVIVPDASDDGVQPDTQMSRAVPFDDCIISMKAYVEQENLLQESLALEGEAAAKCLTGGAPVPPKLSYVKKLKRQKAKGRDDGKRGGSRIRCEDCGFMADGMSGLSVHISMKHPSKEKHFHCLVCGKSFYTVSNLHQHLTSAAHLRNEQNSMEELPGGGAAFKCVKCTDRFETEQELFTHIKEKHEELLREVNKYVLEDTEQINREREENQGCVCKYCGKVCKSSNSMAFLAHVRTHTGTYPSAERASRFVGDIWWWHLELTL